MKKLLVVLICITMITLTGCIKKYTLSDVQTDISAEYMAGLLLNDDKKHKSSLLSQQELIDIQEEERKEKEEQEEHEEKEARKEEKEETKPTPTVDSTNQNSKEQNIHYTLSEVVGDSNFDIKYTGYILADTFPKDEANSFFSIDPRKGYQLLVIDFTLENVTDEIKKIDLSKEVIQYQLDINVGSVYKPQLTPLENDFQYIDMDIEAGAKVPAVLIFEVSRELDVSNINLMVSKDSKTEIIKIK